MDIPTHLLYSKTHEWAEFLPDGRVRVGLTDFAQDSMGDIVFVNLPSAGDSVAVGLSFGDLESVKAVSDLISPVSGQVTAVNEELLDAPAQLNDAPYDAWILEVCNVTAQEDLMDAEAYQAFCEEA